MQYLRTRALIEFILVIFTSVRPVRINIPNAHNIYLLLRTVRMHAFN